MHTCLYKWCKCRVLRARDIGTRNGCMVFVLALDAMMQDAAHQTHGAQAVVRVAVVGVGG